jgi:RNase P protein component
LCDILTRKEHRASNKRGANSEVIVHANPLAGDLVARKGVRDLDFACLHQHLEDDVARRGRVALS